MHHSHGLRRWTVHVAVFALLLKAAVPMLASAAAKARGVPVAEVCDVYGVAIPAPAAGHSGHHQHDHAVAGASEGENSQDHGQHHSGTSHSGDHCALTALAVFTPPGFDHLLWAEPSSLFGIGSAVTRSEVPDEAARWAARLKHGPPTVG